MGSPWIPRPLSTWVFNWLTDFGERKLDMRFTKWTCTILMLLSLGAWANGQAQSDSPKPDAGQAQPVAQPVAQPETAAPAANAAPATTASAPAPPPAAVASTTASSPQSAAAAPPS